MQKDRNVLIVLGPNCDLEAVALRSSLEYFGFNVSLTIIGRPNDFISLFTRRNFINNFNVIVLCFHGRNQKFLMPKLAKSIYEKGEPTIHFGLTELRNTIRFNKQIVICTGCTLGQKNIAELFIRSNASFYIGTRAHPDANSALAFTIQLFYHLAQGDKLNSAFIKAQSIDKETALFDLYA